MDEIPFYQSPPFATARKELILKKSFDKEVVNLIMKALRSNRKKSPFYQEFNRQACF